MTAYYNEHDPKTAAWLRELIKADLIAPGDVDERSIEDVLPSELAGYTQCHFFAGIGVWSYALRCAGWPDSRPVWTGSCPCQPFSAAGKRGGTSDERHLWPAFHWLISQRRPNVVFGEQVESKDGRAWLDTVQADLEAASYAFGAVGLCAAGVGAPHIRGRLFFVADALPTGRAERRAESGGGQVAGNSVIGGLAIANSHSHRANGSGSEREAGGVSEANWAEESCAGEPGRAGDSLCAVGNASSQGLQKRISHRRIQSTEVGSSKGQAAVSRSATNGFWANVEWLHCQDGKFRPTQPGLFPLANGAAARVGRLRGYGNAIVAPVAEEFIRAYLEVTQ